MIASCRRIGRSATARERPQRRSAPFWAVLGKRLDALPAAQQRQREDLRSRLRALARARMPADLGHPVHRSVSSSVETARFASVTAWTTLAPPLTASPAANLRVLGAALLVDGLEQGSELVAWLLADRLDDGVDGITNSLPGTGSGRRRPLSSGAPSRISAQRTPSTCPSPTNATRLVRKRISTPRACELDLVLVGRHLLLGPPVEQEGDVRTEPLRLDRDVDGGVPATDDGDAPADRGRLPALQPLDEGKRLPDALEVVVVVGHVDVGAHPDREHDRIHVVGELLSPAASTRAPSRKSTSRSASSRASSGSGSFVWR